MRRGLKGLAAAAACAAAAILGAAGLLAERPGALLTNRSAGAALKYFGASWAPRWSKLDFAVERLGLLRHRYVLSASDFCLADRRGVFSGCFSRVELAAVVVYTRRGPVVERIERLVALGDGIRMDLRRSAPSAAPGRLPAALRMTPVQAFRVELPRFSVVSSSAAVSGALRVVLAPGARRPLSVSADVLLRRSTAAGRVRADLTADTDFLKGGAPTYVDVVGRVDAGPFGSARGAFRARRGALRYAVSGSVAIALPSGPLRAVRLVGCTGSAPLNAGARRSGEAGLSCRYELAASKVLPEPFSGIRVAKGALSLSGRLDGQRYEAALKATFDPIAAWYALTGDGALRAAGRLDRPWASATVSRELRASAVIPRFEDLVAYLHETKYAVPSPIHVLKGPVSLSLESRGDPRAPRQVVHYAFSSDLTGPRQRLALRAAGDLTVANAASPSRSYENSGELILKDVALELPRLDLGPAPKIFYDKRIKADDDPLPPQAAKAAAGQPRGDPLPLRSRMTVKTEKPLILFSNLTRDPVPVALDLIATSPPAQAAGTVSVRRFDVELFRRRATVDHLNVRLSSGSTVGALDGLVRYKTPAVSIGILISGTTRKPRIELTSVPPLKREDIIALLIFGKSPADLDPEQTASVGNTEAALESEAFGLTSLYLFGATPIEHVGYDSGTRTASVKVRLPGGANMTFGSDFDQSRQLTLRKSLAPHWALESDVTDQGSQQSMAATTFLEWFNRY